MEDLVLGGGMGLAVGSLSMWAYFVLMGLIRSRAEWYAYRISLGKEVPDDWDDGYWDGPYVTLPDEPEPTDRVGNGTTP